MNLGKYLRMLLIGDAGVAALVQDRAYSEVLPDRAPMPAVVFDVVAGDEDHSLDGPTGVRRRSVTVDCWAETREAASALARAVRAALSAHTGGAEGFEVQGVFIELEAFDFDPVTTHYITRLDMEVWTGGAEA